MIVTAHPVQLVLPTGHPRAQGVHLSAIIRCIATESGILKPEWAEELSLADHREITDQTSITRMCIGLAWEDWYIRIQLPEVIDHPGEVEVDKIFMTPDGEELTTLIVDRRTRYALKLHEVKATYKSINTLCGTSKLGWQEWMGNTYDSSSGSIGPFADQWMWLAQAKGYCKGKRTNLIDFHLLCLDNDYSWPMRPQAFRFAIAFTQQEIDDNWELMRDYRDEFLRGTRIEAL